LSSPEWVQSAPSGPDETTSGRRLLARQHGLGPITLCDVSSSPPRSSRGPRVWSRGDSSRTVTCSVNALRDRFSWPDIQRRPVLGAAHDVAGRRPPATARGELRTGGGLRRHVGGYHRGHSSAMRDRLAGNRVEVPITPHFSHLPAAPACILLLVTSNIPGPVHTVTPGAATPVSTQVGMATPCHSKLAPSTQSWSLAPIRLLPRGDGSPQSPRARRATKNSTDERASLPPL